MSSIIAYVYIRTGIEYFNAQLYHQRMVSAVEAVSTRLAPGGGHIGSAGGGPVNAGAQHVHLRLTIHARASPRQ